MAEPGSGVKVRERGDESAEVTDAKARLERAARPELVSIPIDEYRALIGLRDVAGQYLEIKTAGTNPPELIVPARNALRKAHADAVAYSPQARVSRGE